MSGPLDVDPDAPICPTGNRPYRTEEAALAALRSAREGRSKGAIEGHRPGLTENAVTHCKVCHWWHLESKAKGNTAGRRQKGRRRR